MKNLKLFIKLILLIINNVILIPFNLFKIFFFLKKKKNIFLQNEGGFGHSITSPLVLNNYFGENWSLLFSYYYKRHNKNVDKIFSNLIFLNVAIFPVNSYLSNKIAFKVYYFFIKYILKKKVNYIQDFYNQLPVSKENMQNKTIKDCMVRSKLYWQMGEKKFKFIKNINFSKNSNFEKLLDEKKKILNFSLRYKDCKSNIGEIGRDSKKLDFYKNALLRAVDNNWFIMLSGDVKKVPSWVIDNDNIYYYGKTKLDLNYFNFLSGIKSTACIGPHSGSLLYNVARKTSCLVLEHSFLGDVMPNSIVSYKNLENRILEKFKSIFLNYEFLKTDSYKKFNNYFRSLTQKESDEIINEFLDNHQNNDFGIDVRDIGINQGLFLSSNSKLSPAWVKQNFDIISKIS